MHRTLALASVSAALGCEGRKWIDTHATQIHVAGLEANIPAGWRDFNELVKKPDVKLPEGSRMLLLDSNEVGGTIVVGPIAIAVDPDQCEAAAVGIRMQLPEGSEVDDVKRALFHGVNPGCLMSVRSDAMRGRVAIMTAKNGRTVTIACLSNGKFDEAEDACYEVINGLTPVP